MSLEPGDSIVSNTEEMVEPLTEAESKEKLLLEDALLGDPITLGEADIGKVEIMMTRLCMAFMDPSAISYLIPRHKITVDQGKYLRWEPDGDNIKVWLEPRK
jgi:hypothetical protein